MRLIQLLLLLASLAEARPAIAADWKHLLKGPEILSDEVVKKVYPKERDPGRHNGITLSNYLKEFELQTQKLPRGCFRPKLQKWLVESTIYLRPNSATEIYQGKARWQPLADFNCRSQDSFFNTWEGSHFHEQQHYLLRDERLQKFMKELRTLQLKTCEASEDAAKLVVLKALEQFLIEVHAADTEDRAEALEHDFYVQAYERLSGTKCALSTSANKRSD